MLKASSLNFVGNVEGHDIFTGEVDVVVMDGFTGNVVLKASETLAELVDRPHARGGGARRASAGWGRGSSSPRFRAAQAAQRRLPRTAGRRSSASRAAASSATARSNARAVKHGIRAAAEFHASGVNAAIEAELRGPRRRARRRRGA